MGGTPDNQPLRLAGLGLLAVAGIAAVVGLVSLAGSGSDAAQPDPALQAPPSSSPATPPPPAVPTSAVPAPDPALPAPPPDQFTSPTVPLPGAGLPNSGGAGAADSAGGGSGSGGKGSVTKAPVRVYNNSKVTGLADRAADDIRESGWSVTEVGNWSYSNLPTSTVYYRPGTSEQAAARSLAGSFGLRSEPRFSGIRDASPGLIVIVTKDFQRR